MALPAGFQFSASSLQDYVDCPRRFQLRYLLNVAWPAPQVEPMLESEQYARLGRDFHRLAHQYTLGIPKEAISAGITDEALARWWESYLAFVSRLPAGSRHPEAGLSAPLSGHRLLAQYDLLIIPQNGEGLLIVDWKTYRRRPERRWLGGRLQTQVYRYLGSRAGGRLSDARPIAPEQVEMIYWFANFPNSPERFPYSAAEQAADRERLSGLIEEIERRREETWTQTADERRCLYCDYRSLCERGTQPGQWDEAEEGFEPEDEDRGLDLDFDFGQVQELAY